MRDDEETTNDILLAMIMMLLLVPASIFMYSWCVSWLWGWFATPLGFPAISMPHAFGLVLLVRMLVPSVPGIKKKQTTRDVLAEALVHSIIAPVLVVVSGWVLVRWFGI